MSKQKKKQKKSVAVGIANIKTTFNNTITPNLDTAKQQITDHVTHLDFIDSVSGLTAPVKVDTKPICGWGRWSRI